MFRLKANSIMQKRSPFRSC